MKIKYFKNAFEVHNFLMENRNQHGILTIEILKLIECPESTGILLGYK